MSTPFEFFRRNQKVALAAVTGMAILSFLVQDAVSNSGEMSQMGVGVLLIGSLSIIGWVWGSKEGKSGDNALWGAIVGAAITLGMMFMSRPPAAMSAVTGNLSVAELRDRVQDQTLANRMLSNVFYKAEPDRARMEPFFAQMGRPRLILFSYDADPAQSAIISELLNREADDLGIEVTDQAVMDYLKQVAGKDRDGDDYLTRQLFSSAIKDTSGSFDGGASEEMIFAALRRELRAQQAGNLLVGGRRLTPVDVWDLHRKLSTRASAQVIAVPVNDFVKKDATPSDAELQELFTQYKDNIPNYKGKPDYTFEGGRPGFYLDRRMRLAYLEPNYDEIKKQVAAITDEEIQKRYEERYQRDMPSDIGDGMNLDMGVLPTAPKAAPAGEAAPPEGSQPESGTTPPAPPTSEPVGEKPADPPQPEQPAKPAEEKPATEKPADPPKPEGSSRRSNPNSKFQPVALLQEADAAKPAEAPASDAAPAAAPAAESKPADAPSTDPAAPPADTKPAATDKLAGEEPAPPTGEKPAAAPLTVPPVADPQGDSDPAPPVAKVRPLDDELKQQIRQELLNERLQPLLSTKTEAARDFINDLQLQVAEYLEHERNLKEEKKSQLSEEALSPEAATEEIKKYAKEHDLSYHVTELLTIGEITSSEDYPFSGAMVHQSTVGSVLFRLTERDLYRAMKADRMGENLANVTFWTIEDVAEHAPASTDEPGVKDAVVKAWRDLKARPVAEARAKTLSELVSKSDKPMAEAVSEQTVTGDKDSLFVTVNSTAEFSWLQRGSAANPFSMQDSPIRLGAIDGVKGAGAKFMEKVFDEMKPGDTAVVPNEDLSIFYVVKLEKRTPATDSEQTVMKDNFLSLASSPLIDAATRAANSYNGDFKSRLMMKHGVKMPSGKQIEN